MHRFQIYRYDPDQDLSPRMQTFDLEIEQGDRMLLDVLIKLKAIDPTLSFRRSCREGVCGSDAMNINGKTGLACVTNMRSLPITVVLKPLPGLPVIRDLFVDMTGFFKQYHSIRPWLVNEDPPPEKERLQSPEARDELNGLYECILCACCSSAARATGGTRTNTSARPVCFRPIASWSTAVTWPAASGSTTCRIPTGCFAAARSSTAPTSARRA